MTTELMIALLQSRYTISDYAWISLATLPSGLSCSCNVVSKRYAPNKNQAIHRMISCQTICQMELVLRHLTIRMYQ